jgi:hypothetical protein
MSQKPIVLCVDDTASILEGRQMLLEENEYIGFLQQPMASRRSKPV